MIPNEIMIHTTTDCKLKCEPCARHRLTDMQLNKLGEMDFNAFKKYINIVTKAGVKGINITPIIGEPTEWKYFKEACHYLNSKKEIEYFTFFTNLIKPDLIYLTKFKKLRLVISVNGFNCDQWIKNTGGTVKDYNEFAFNYFTITSELMKKKLSQNLTFFVRDTAEYIYNKYSMLMKVSKGQIINFQKNGNWCGLIPDSETIGNNFYIQHMKKEGICSYINNENCILPNGDIVLCGATDPLLHTIIGNIKDFESIYSLNFRYIKENQSNNIYTEGCKKCSEFHAITNGQN